MPSLEVWTAFVLASILILVIPGPTIVLVISQAVVHGYRSVLPLVSGVLLGDFTAMTFSLLGLGALLSASAALFNGLKWIGALYLVYLGITLWRNNPKKNEIHPVKCLSGASLFRSSFVVTALNPKSLAFFIAFLPQFVEPGKPVLIQLILLGTTFLFLATVNAAFYALFAGQASEVMKRKGTRIWLQRCGGGILVSAGIMTAGMRFE